MSRWLYVFRFFAVAPPMPLLMIGALVVVTSVAAIVIVVEPKTTARALTPVLLLQIFACSSGFDVPARRGHYDLLMTRGQTRLQIVTAHWAASALPGVTGWLVLAFVCATVGAEPSHVSLFSSGTVAAMALVSTIPWAVTLRLPRFAGAIGWLLVVTLAMLVVPDVLMTQISGDGSAVGRALPGLPGLLAWVQTAGAVLIYPPLLVGSDLSGAHALVVLPGIVFAAAALTVGFWSAIRRDIPLEAAQ